MSHPPLTRRQLLIWKMIATGNYRTQIAGQLAVSTKTVDVHRHRLCEKLGLEHTADLTRAAIAYGIIPIPTPADFAKKTEVAA